MLSVGIALFLWGGKARAQAVGQGLLGFGFVLLSLKFLAGRRGGRGADRGAPDPDGGARGRPVHRLRDGRPPRGRPPERDRRDDPPDRLHPGRAPRRGRHPAPRAGRERGRDLRRLRRRLGPRRGRQAHRVGAFRDEGRRGAAAPCRRSRWPRRTTTRSSGTARTWWPTPTRSSTSSSRSSSSPWRAASRRLLERAFPGSRGTGSRGKTVFIDREHLPVAGAALGQVAREIMRMADMVQEMLDDAVEVICRGNADRIGRIEQARRRRGRADAGDQGLPVDPRAERPSTRCRPGGRWNTSASSPTWRTSAISSTGP